MHGKPHIKYVVRSSVSYESNTLDKILIAAHYYLLFPAIYHVCWQYMFNVSSCVWVLSGVEFLRGPVPGIVLLHCFGVLGNKHCDFLKSRIYFVFYRTIYVTTLQKAYSS